MPPSKGFDPAGPSPGARRSRGAVSVLFILAGVVMGSWAGRIPSVREQVGVSDGVWGLVILAAPVAVLTVLLVQTRIIGRTGARVMAVPGAVGLLLLVPLSALSTSPWMLAGLLFVQGLAQGLLFSPMNVLAVEVEREYRRSILSSFHAWFSLGQLTGGLLGVLAGALLVAPAVQIGVTNGALAVALLIVVRQLPHDRPDPAPVPHPRDRPPRAKFTRQLWLLTLIGFLTSINEGAATQWSALYSVSLGASVAIGSLTLVCFSVAIAAVRLRGDRWVEKLGPRTFLQVSAAVSATGMAVALLIGTVPAALIGFACLGLGSGCIVPTVTSLAGRQPGIPSGQAVALVNLGSWPAFLLGPPVIGGLAEWVGLRGALVVVVVGALAVGTLAGRVRAPRPATDM